MSAPDMTGLRGLISKLTAFKVKHWGADSAMPSGEDPDPDRESVADVEQAQVVSSLRKERIPVTTFDLFSDEPQETAPVHAVVLDIDHEAWLIPSSTPGHSHLYIDVEVPEPEYFALLDALAAAGVIEHGYAKVSQERGHTDVRLPWVKKGDPLPSEAAKAALPVHPDDQEPF